MNRWLVYSVKLESYLGVGTQGPTKEILKAGRFTAAVVLSGVNDYPGDALATLAPEFYVSANISAPCHKHAGTATIH